MKTKILGLALLCFTGQEVYGKNVDEKSTVYENIMAGGEVIAKDLEKNEPSRRAMDLYGANLGPEDVKLIAKALEKNNTLEELNLEDNNIQDEGAKALARALEKNNTLTSLSLQRSGIRIEGAEALAKALKTNETLTELYLEDNYIGNDLKEEIYALLERNRAKSKE